MKKSITIFKRTILVVLLLFAAQLTNAANFYAYKGKSVTINGGGTFAEYKWILVSQPDGTTNTVIAGQTTSALTQTFTDAGQYKLRLQVRNSDGCWSDVDATTDVDIFVLPDFTVAVAPEAGSSDTYCTNVVAADRSKLKATATVTGSVTLPSEITFALADWYKTPTAAGDITGVTASATATNPYLVTETTVASYYFVATGKYNVPTGRLISAAGDPVKSAAVTVTVKAAPTTPAITPVVTN